MSINLVTYANQTVTPTNDAIIYERAIDQNGIFYGCNVTVTSNTVNITGGYGLVCGREFVINSDSLTVTLAPSGTLQGRLYVRLDLADADAPIQLLTVTGNTLPALVQDDDVNYTNGVYEMELATFTVGVSALSDCVETYETIMGGKTDYIVEQGTDGVWKYRKWYSGTAECWRIAELSVSSWGSWGSWSYSVQNLNIDFPTGLFIDVPIIEVTKTGGVDAVPVVASVNATRITTLYGVRPNAAASGITSFSIHATGVWK